MMKSGRLKIVFFLSLLLLTGSFAQRLAAEEPRTDQFLRQLNEIGKRLVTVEQKQQEVLAEKDKILEEISRVRIWVRHSGG